MMKNISMLLALLFLSVGMFGQVGKDKKDKKHEKHAMMQDPEAHAMMYADKMATRLDLTPEQKEEVQELQMKRLQAHQELMADYKGNMDKDDEDMANEKADMHKQKMKIQEDFKEDMKEILNDAQFQKWETMHNREMKMQGMKKGHYKDKKKEETDWK